MQDEGSQLLALLTDAKRGEMVVDFCAGAGGKTLALGAAMRNTGRLYAFDTSGHRLDALKPRLARSGLSNVHPVQIAHERDERIKRLAGKIDRVLVDAPCSGLGTLRRNPDLKWRQSPQAVAELQAKQAAILASAARLLKPGGRLVYATCSLLRGRERGDRRGLRRSSTRRLRRRCRLQALLAQAQVERRRRAGAAAATCGCGRTGMAPTASLPRSGSGAERCGRLICRKPHCVQPTIGQCTLSNSRASLRGSGRLQCAIGPDVGLQGNLHNE